ncbi:hypothetical protein DRO02_03010 [archaeon]|nr:MAG: hypothetical protein DRO21_02885 [archaeon]RLG65025.1 MAG: hypothetical protein DRO02_03010 [archaeon]HDM23597.1 DUF1743 domain-containing protein [Candidatus Bathyarchaeota archaeon]
MPFIHIGIDDTDSTRKGCTTYIGAILAEKLSKVRDVKFVDYPNLIRLNPNAPWKTRGNGAVCLRVRHPEENIVDKIVELISETVEKHSDLKDPNTNPSACILVTEDKHIPNDIIDFAYFTVRYISKVEKAEELISRHKIETIVLKDKRGLIGALAAIGMTLTNTDYTYELLAYRCPTYIGTPRKIDVESVYLMDKLTRPYTFNNVDEKRILITPHGRDPVLYGIRGEYPSILLKAYEIVKVYEPIERYVIYRSNQGTDMHMVKISSLTNALQYMNVIIELEVSSNPVTITGSHTFFEAKDAKGCRIRCVAFEPTGILQKTCQKLIPGDKIVAYGAVKFSPDGTKSINLEKLEIIELAKLVTYRNPKCPKCGATMKSEGKGKGYQCKKCKFKLTSAKKIPVEIPRSIAPGLYVARPKARRHLTKPPERYGLEKRRFNFKISEYWFKIFN